MNCCDTNNYLPYQFYWIFFQMYHTNINNGTWYVGEKNGTGKYNYLYDNRLDVMLSNIKIFQFILRFFQTVCQKDLGN